MESLRWAARAAGLVGVVLCVIASLARVSGTYQLGSYQPITVLQAGTTVMVLACLLYLASIAERRTA